MRADYETISFRAFLESAELEPSAAEKVTESGFEGYEARKAAFLSGASFEGDAFSALVFYARLAYETRFRWRDKGIPFEVWRDTFTDLGIWQKACRRECGVTGLKETAWLENHLRGKIFRLGRLQFAPDRADGEFVKRVSALNADTGATFSVSEGERIYYVHIPEGAPLTTEACDKSFAAAASFFGGRMLFVCDSWILSPKLRPLLPQSSNLAKFAGRFRIVSEDPSSRSAERYVFGTTGEPDGYPERTSLQKAVKELLCKGGAVGTAAGIFAYPVETD